jgi:hypothetical protein
VPFISVWSREPGGSPLKITIEVYYAKSIVIKDKSNDSAVYLGHMTLSYLL